MLEVNENSLFPDANSFSIYIETMVVNNKDLNHVDAILKFCEENLLEPEDITHLVSKSLKSKLELDYVELRYFKPQAMLEF